MKPDGANTSPLNTPQAEDKKLSDVADSLFQVPFRREADRIDASELLAGERSDEIAAVVLNVGVAVGIQVGVAVGIGIRIGIVPLEPGIAGPT
jgi:hypothetical protein